MINSRFFQKTVFYSFCLLVFLVPLVLTSVNYELFEFNKITVTYLITIIISFGWVGKMIAEKRIILKKTPLDIPILLYLLSSVLSTLFSIHPYTSVWGYYSRFHGGLASALSYIVLFYAFVSNLNKKQALYVLYSLLASAFLVTFYGILERFGIDAKYWIQDVQNRVFSTLGQPNWLGAFINALIFIPLAFILSSKKKASRITFYILLFTFYLCLIFTNSKSSILAFWIGLFSFTTLLLFPFKGNNQKGEKKGFFKILGLIWVSFLLIYLILGKNTYSYLKKAPLWLKIFSQKNVSVPTPQPKTESKPKPFISESSEIRSVVWKGAIKIWQHYPMFGSGLETFGYSYYNFRPKEHNLLSEWDFLYNKAHNEFLNILACQGTVGIVTYIILIGSFILWSLKTIYRLAKKEDSKTTHYQLLIASFLSSYITILITNFFGFSVVIIGILFFLIPAFAFTFTDSGLFREFSSTQSGKKKIIDSGNLHVWQVIAIIILLFLTLYFLLFIINKWKADYHFNKGENFSQSNYLLNSLQELQKAVDLSPNEALFHTQLAESAALMAIGYNQLDATESAELTAQLKDLALQETEICLLLNPVHLNFYKSQAKVYIYLSSIDEEYKNKAIDTLLIASSLAPTDAKLLYNIGLLYEQTEQQEKAIKIWEKAADLKPNYFNVYLDLANLYIKIGENEKAKQKLNYILKNIYPNDKRADQMLKEIEDKEL